MNNRMLLIAAITASFCFDAAANSAAISFRKQWTHKHEDAGQVSEIPAFDKKTNTIWVAGVVGVDVLDADTGSLLKHIDLTDYGFVNSVAIHNGLAAFAIEAALDRRKPGRVVFFDTKTLMPSDGVNQIAVGALPDMLVFSHDGSRLLVANEATPNAVADNPYTNPDPSGRVSIIDMATRSVVGQPTFDGVPVGGENLRTNVGMDFEPEYIAIDPDGTEAFVTLQEANGIGVLDLTSNEFSTVIGLGLKDFSLADNGFGGSNFIDPSDDDGIIEPRFSRVKGLYQPDSIATYQFQGQTYLVMANEGDTREDEADKARASKLSGAPQELSRLNVSKTDSSADNLVTFGGRSLSIRDTAGNLVYDSGNLLDVEAIARNIYDDKRSDDKGVEPEGVNVMKIADRTYAFVGLERTLKSAVAVFDITNPTDVSFIDMIVTEGDIAPEGLAAFHHQGNFYLAIANEVSNTTTLYLVDRVASKSKK